jgi:L-alanine-DL-glutamate epimerase-like enolase superfamily enzyme
LGISACELAQLPCPPQSVTTVFTLFLDTPENIAKVTKLNSHRPLLNLKLGRDRERVAAVHNAAPNCRLVIDANTGWTIEQLKSYLPRLKQLGVEMVEQPLPVGQDWQLKGLDSILPICADESCMIGTSLAMAPALLLAQVAKWLERV